MQRDNEFDGAKVDQVGENKEAIIDLEGLEIPKGKIQEILQAMKDEVPADWLVGRTWDVTHQEFAKILKNGKFPNRLRFFELTIPDQKLFFQFLGTAISLGVIAGSMVYHWASTTLGAEYIGAFGWAMIPLGGIASKLIIEIDSKRRKTQHDIVRAIRGNARKAGELLRQQRETAEIFRSLFEAFEQVGYKRSERLLRVLNEIIAFYSPLSKRPGRKEVIAALEGGDFPILDSVNNTFKVLYGLTPSGDQPATVDDLIQEIHRRIQQALAPFNAPTATQLGEAEVRKELGLP